MYKIIPYICMQKNRTENGHFDPPPVMSHPAGATSSAALPPPRAALCSHFRIHGMFNWMPLYATTASQRWRSAAMWPLSALHRRHGYEDLFLFSMLKLHVTSSRFCWYLLNIYQFTYTFSHAHTRAHTHKHTCTISTQEEWRQPGTGAWLREAEESLC